jgi:protein TonB
MGRKFPTKKPARCALLLVNINQEANMDNLEHMERRHFALPAAFVFTLLAFLFFGTSRPRGVVPPLVVPIKTPPPKGDEIEIKTFESPPPFDFADAETVTKPRGGGEPPPTSDVDLSRSLRHDGIFVAVEAPRPYSGIGGMRIIPAYYGPGNGSGDRLGPTTDIIPAGLLDKPPRARLQVSPVYPTREKSTGTTGRVEVEFTVDETGAVMNPSVVSSTDRAFEEPTLRAVEKWRFLPGRHHGQVVRFRMRVPVLFNLND